ncbi:MAG: DNA integrity scanning protein DisA, partial [Limnochordia bacterium]
GSEGRLVKMQLEESMADIADEGLLVTKDYCIDTEKPPEEIWNEIVAWDSEDLLNLPLIARALGYSGSSSLEQAVTPKGFRILNKIPRLPMPVIENLIDQFHYFPDICSASIEELDDVEGIGEVRAKAIQEGLRRIREQVLLDRHL